MSIYRKADGESVIKTWCEHQVAAGPWDTLRTFETSLGETHLAATGTGSPAVLWLPGTNFNAATSAELAEHLGTRFRTYVVDLPGQPGLSSSTPLVRRRIARYGLWVNEVVSQLDEKRIIVAGHSLGAAVALAGSPVPAIAGVALIGPAGLARVRITPKLLADTMRWLIRPSDSSASALLQFMQHPTSRVDPTLAEWMALVGKYTKQPGAPGPLPKEQLRAWRDRAIVLTGEADPFFPASKLTKASVEILNTNVSTVSGAGHLLPDENPTAVLEALVELATRSA